MDGLDGGGGRLREAGRGGDCVLGFAGVESEDGGGMGWIEGILKRVPLLSDTIIPPPCEQASCFLPSVPAHEWDVA